MKLFGYEIVKAKEITKLRTLNENFEQLLRDKRPSVNDKFLKGKNIKLSEGAVFVNSVISECRIDGFGPLEVMGNKAIIVGNIFKGR